MDEFFDVICEDPRWQGAGLAELAAPALAATFAELGLPQQGFTLCIMGCDDARIAALNADFRGKPSPTNVLSWPSAERGAAVAGDVPAPPIAGPLDDPEHLGDIALSYDTCMAESHAAQKPPFAHISHLIVHGVLHLLGYDHIRDADGDVMEALEGRILARLGLPNPYSDPQ
ncbi:MAG: rRNA maturation RNase YbeY [Cypionkella sp.]|nr:rRNA maturation RNase YbeY [Cypionkella sp.]